MVKNNLFINKIALEVTDQTDYKFEELSQEQMKKIFPLYRIEKFYNRVSNYSFVPWTLYKEGKAYTSFDLSYNLIRKISNEEKRYEVIMLAQSYPDRLCGSPLAKLLHKTSLSFNKVIGLTHMESLASIEALNVVDTMISENSCGLVILTEMLPFRHQKVRNSQEYNHYGDFSVGLEVSKRDGKIEIINITRFISQTSCIDQKNEFISFMLKKIRETLSTYQIDYIIVQNQFRQLTLDIPNLYERKLYKNINFLSGDVWISLVDMIKSNKLESNNNILLVSFNRFNNINFCILRLLDNFKNCIVE